MLWQDPADLVAEAFGTPGMRETFAIIQRLAAHAKAVLICGETGTGKELAALAFHHESRRRARPFITINCSSVMSTPFERELFGYERGAFDGAAVPRIGLLETADRGTLFFDEIADLPLPAQARLLRVFDDEIHRLGSLESRSVDVAIVAATSRDLQREAGEGRFRADLYYRLTGAELTLPPLRQRREDIPHLAACFMRDCGARIGRTFDGLTPAAERLLHDAPWHGNVRELRLTIERACLLATGPVLSERDLGDPLHLH